MGLPDEDILAIAKSQGRIVLTEDRDFGRLAIRYKRPAIGIVLVQVNQLPGSIAEIAAYTVNVIEKLSNSCTGTFTVIGPGRTRQRPL
jgi:predicted nuclease of predicted toxin-antitoxin system